MHLKLTLVSIIMVLTSCLSNKEETIENGITANHSKEKTGSIDKCFAFSETSAINKAEKELIKTVNKKLDKEFSIKLPENVTREYRVFENDTTLNKVVFNYKQTGEMNLYFEMYVYYYVTLYDNLNKIEYNFSAGRAYTSENIITILQDDNILIEGRTFGMDSGTDFTKFNEKVLFEKEFKISID